MKILKQLLQPLQEEFQKNCERGTLFIDVLLSIIIPFTASRGSNILRSLKILFGLKLGRKKFYRFMASPRLERMWDNLWLIVWRLIPKPMTNERLLLALDLIYCHVCE